jgi:hypothetical protein
MITLNFGNDLLYFCSESFIFSTYIFKSEDIISKIMFLPVVLYGYENWSLTLREEHRFREFENRVLRSFMFWTIDHILLR